MTPERRRRAVVVLVDRFGVSERRACQVVGQWRSTQRKPSRPPADSDQRLRLRLRELAAAHPRWGWKMAYRLLRREGMTVNHKRIRRLWREEGLRRPPSRKRKRRRPGDGSGVRQRATAPGDVWAIDMQFDETADLRRLKLCNIVDEYCREALAIRVARTCTADDVTATLDRLVAVYGPPKHLRMDNGPELIAAGVRDWCRFSGTNTIYIEPGAPWENPYVESFNGRVRDEILNIEEFGSVTEAQVLIEAWRVEYNTYRPHGSLGGLTPVEYRRQWTTRNQPQLS